MSEDRPPVIVEEAGPTSRPAAPAGQTPVSIVDVLAEWLLYVSAALIVTGLMLPSIHKPGMLGGTTYNLMGVVEGLWESKREILALILVVFSFVFPLAKTFAAAVIFRMGRRATKEAASVMQFLGKWSMLDVFLAALLIGLTQIAAFMTVEPRMGLYFFTAGVLLNNIATTRLTFTRAG